MDVNQHWQKIFKAYKNLTKIAFELDAQPEKKLILAKNLEDLLTANPPKHKIRCIFYLECKALIAAVREQYEEAILFYELLVLNRKDFLPIAEQYLSPEQFEEFDWEELINSYQDLGLIYLLFKDSLTTNPAKQKEIEEKSKVAFTEAKRLCAEHNIPFEWQEELDELSVIV